MLEQIKNLKPLIARPGNFDLFWKNVLGELDQVPCEVEWKELGIIRPGLTRYAVSFTSLAAVRIHGYLLLWDRPAPLVIHTNGYNAPCTMQSSWARRGVNVLGFDTRGFGGSADGVSLSASGHILTGIMDPEESILKGAVCDYIQAHRAVDDLLDLNGNRAIYYGFSFAGAMAIQAAAIARSADMVVAGVPSLGWQEQRIQLAGNGSALELKQYIQSFPEAEKAVLRTLSYFDTVHFAPRVSCPTLIGVGLEDDVVPPETVFAIANHLRCPRQIRVFPSSHAQNDHRIWAAFYRELLKLAMNPHTACGWGYS
ncbi:MAG: acetylxylan esterase [Aquisalimonadaceae bacterium]